MIGGKSTVKKCSNPYVTHIFNNHQFNYNKEIVYNTKLKGQKYFQNNYKLIEPGKVI